MHSGATGFAAKEGLFGPPFAFMPQYASGYQSGNHEQKAANCEKQGSVTAGGGQFDAVNIDEERGFIVRQRAADIRSDVSFDGGGAAFGEEGSGLFLLNRPCGAVRQSVNRELLAILQIYGGGAVLE